MRWLEKFKKKISHGLEQHIIHEVLQYRKVSCRWVPKQPDQEEYVSLLRRFRAEGNGFLLRIVAGDECLVLPAREIANQQDVLPRRTNEALYNSGKSMITLF